MGSMKEYMHELWSQRDAEVSFICPESGHAVSARLKLPSDLVNYECLEEVTYFRNGDECRRTVIIHHDYIDGFTAALEDAPDVDVDIVVGNNSYEGWDEPEPEPDAYGIFLRAMADWKRNVSELGTPFGTTTRNQMLFTTLYSILEAYLSDAIIGAAMENVAVQRKMLKLESLKDKQIKLETILDKPDIVKEMVKTTLQGLSFHNLNLVNSICHTCFGENILPFNHDDRTFIMKSINKRHDCVHRNGFDKFGDKHGDITRNYLDKMGALFEGVANTLFEAIRNAQVKKYFQENDH